MLLHNLVIVIDWFHNENWLSAKKKTKINTSYKRNMEDLKPYLV